MIKPVDVLPISDRQKKRSKREEVRLDLKEAMDRGINTFELDGEYNYKYLAQYAREEAFKLISAKYRELWDQEKRERGIFVRLYMPIVYKIYKKYITVYSVKAEDRTHVYVRLSLESMPEDVKKAMDEEYKNYWEHHDE